MRLWDVRADSVGSSEEFGVTFVLMVFNNIRDTVRGFPKMTALRDANVSTRIGVMLLAHERDIKPQLDHAVIVLLTS